MAEEQSRRPYRASEPPLRSHAGTSNNDPLAELARLIGQTDPFGEFGRDTARRSAAPVERADWNTPAPSSPYAPRDEADWRESSSQRPDGNGYYNARGVVGEQSAPADYDDQNYGRQPYGGAQELPRDDLYQADHEAEVIHRVRPIISTTHTNKMRLSILRMSITIKRRLLADAWGSWRLLAYLLWRCWHRRCVWLSRVVWLLRVHATAARYQSGCGSQQSCAGNKQQGRAIEQTDH